MILLSDKLFLEGKYKMKYKNKLILTSIVFFSNYFLDRVTKILAIEHLQYLRGSEKPIIGQLVFLSYVENEGAFLSVGSAWEGPLKALLFIILPLIACIFALLYCIFREENKISVILIVSIIAGGLGNIQDRIFNDGKVTDFLRFAIGDLSTGVLNFADMSITFGAILLLLYEIYKTSNEKKLTSVVEQDEN